MNSQLFKIISIFQVYELKHPLEKDFSQLLAWFLFIRKHFFSFLFSLHQFDLLVSFTVIQKPEKRVLSACLKLPAEASYSKVKAEGEMG